MRLGPALGIPTTMASTCFFTQGFHRRIDVPFSGKAGHFIKQILTVVHVDDRVTLRITLLNTKAANRPEYRVCYLIVGYTDSPAP